MATIEARPYGADMTPDERLTLLSRVYVVEPGIVFYREIPVQSVESIDLMLARLDELGCQWPPFIEVLVLLTVARPSAAVRAMIPEHRVDRRAGRESKTTTCRKRSA
jgi:hypothetical protein